MGEIADEHYTEMFWEEGTGVGEYTSEYGIGPIDHPAYGGMNAYIARRTSRIAAQYSCKFCGGEIKFIDRRPYNMADGSAHTCLADKNKRMQAKLKEAEADIATASLSDPATKQLAKLRELTQKADVVPNTAKKVLTTLEQVQLEPWFIDHIEKVKAEVRAVGYTEGYNEGYNCAQNQLTKED